MIKDLVKDDGKYIELCDDCSYLRIADITCESPFIESGQVVYLGGIFNTDLDSRNAKSMIDIVMKCICMEMDENDPRYEKLVQYYDSGNALTAEQINYAKVKLYCSIEFWPGELTNETVEFLRSITK